MEVKIGSIYNWDGKNWMVTGETTIMLSVYNAPAWVLYDLNEPQFSKRVSKMLFGSSAKKVSKDD